jgi:hypothetical protein
MTVGTGAALCPRHAGMHGPSSRPAELLQAGYAPLDARSRVGVSAAQRGWVAMMLRSSSPNTSPATKRGEARRRAS